MMRARTAWAALLAMAIAPSAAAGCVISGRISGDGLPLSGAEIVEMRLGSNPRTVAVTSADGRFSATLAPLPADLQVFKIVLRRKDFADKTLLLQKDENGCPMPASADVKLERPHASVQPGGQDLCARPSVNGLTIYLAPYSIYGAGDDGLASSLNGDLPEILHHRILAFQSRLGLRRSDEISVEPTCLPLNPAQAERIRQVGNSLNALAVIAGDGEVRGGENGQLVVDLDSVFRAIPVWRDLGGTLLPIRDTIPAARLRPSRVAEQLTDVWGKSAVLAVALHRLAEQPPKLAEVRRLLIELRRTMTADDPLLPEVQALLARLEGIR